MLLGSANPSPFASAWIERHVDGMNCIGPTARSYTVSPSRAPPSVSRISATFGRPSSGMPRIRRVAEPSSRNCAPPNRPWFDSTRPIAASNVHGTPQPGSLTANRASACLYARTATAGIPLSPSVLITGAPSSTICTGFATCPEPTGTASSWSGEVKSSNHPSSMNGSAACASAASYERVAGRLETGANPSAARESTATIPPASRHRLSDAGRPPCWSVDPPRRCRPCRSVGLCMISIPPPPESRFLGRSGPTTPRIGYSEGLKTNRWP
jgi:hypothetical protein